MDINLHIDAEYLQRLNAEQANHYKVIPYSETPDEIHFITAVQERRALEEELELIFGKKIIFALQEPEVVDLLLAKFYRLQQNSDKVYVQQEGSNDDDRVHKLIIEAKSLRSSDIHLEIYEKQCRIRFRMDGMLVEKYIIPKEEYPVLVNRIKIMSGLDIAEKRLPQDGRIHFAYQESKFDIRVSSLPTMYGEKIVMRILSNDATNIDIEKLGFGTQELQSYLEGIKKPNGIVLISGPTGSGKTTTLYATLKILNKTTRNLLTIEDPIEYTLGGVNQVQLKENIGLNFGAALRTFLRQDPDIIMVGEIRDPETANMAIRASLTGHLVLSTIHTNSAWSTVARLQDMGIPAFLIAGTLNTSVAQRLVRLLCPHCKKETNFDISSYPSGFKAPRKLERHFVAEGCTHCYYTGYKGRKAIYEVITLDADLAQRIRKQDPDVSEALNERDVKLLADHAFELFEKGETSLEEVYSLLLNF